MCENLCRSATRLRFEGVKAAKSRLLLRLHAEEFLPEFSSAGQANRSEIHPHRHSLSRQQHAQQEIVAGLHRGLAAPFPPVQ